MLMLKILIGILIELFFVSSRLLLLFVIVGSQRPSASVIEAMDFIWQHRRKFKSSHFVPSSGNEDF